MSKNFLSPVNIVLFSLFSKAKVDDSVRTIWLFISSLFLDANSDDGGR